MIPWSTHVTGFVMGSFLQASVLLAKVYKDHYKAAKEQLASQPKSKQFDFDEQVGPRGARALGHCGLTAVTTMQMQVSYYWSSSHKDAAYKKCSTAVCLQAIFLKFDLFTKRLNKLIDMFTTIHQFSTLEQHTHIEGLEQMIRNLNNIIGGCWGLRQADHMLACHIDPHDQTPLDHWTHHSCCLCR